MLYNFFLVLHKKLYARLKTKERLRVVPLSACVLMSSINASASPPHSSSIRKIVVYTTNGCHKCAVLKEWLKTVKGDFEERNLENVDVMTELVMRNVVVLSAPLLEIDDAVYIEAQFFNGNTLAVDRLHEIFGEKHNE